VPGKGPGLHPSGVHGPRLKSLDLPKWLYIHTYVHTYLHPYTYIAARNLPGLCSALLCSVLSCPVLFYASRLFRRQYHQYALPCPALQRTTLHCTALYCTVLYRGPPAFAVCAAVYHRTTTDPGSHFLSPIHRLHANVIVSIVPGPALCHGYPIIYLPLTPRPETCEQVILTCLCVI
jgi:hypothetical protein